MFVSKKTPRSFLFVLVIFMTLLPFSARAESQKSWNNLLSEIRGKYSDIPQLSAQTLIGWMREKDSKSFLLLDVREPEEFEVSHLRNAKRVSPGSDPNTVFSELDRATAVVTYCSVGYRSSEYARKMREAGFREVYNLEGSIFGWVRAGYPVYRGGQEVHKVHPYNRFWGKYLEKQYH